MQSITSFSLTPIPFFVLMGEVLFHTGVALKAIDAFAVLIRRVPGRLAVIAIVAGTVFSAISGSTIATTALLGSLMLPTMLQRGYEPRFAMGPIMGIGGVDMLIPPSALTVLLGSLAGISISGLLIGGIVPGLVLSAMFVGYIIIRSTFNPALAPDEGLEAGPTGLTRWAPFFIHVLPLVLIFGLVVGAMTRGWATPTEAAALGAAGTILAAAAYRRLTFGNLMKALTGTVAISGTILFIIVGRNHLFAGAELFGRGQRSDRPSNRPRPLDHRAGDRDAADPVVPWLLCRPGQHDADHAAVLHAAGAAPRHRSDLVRRAVPDLHAAWPADTAVRPAAVHDEGRGSGIHHDESDLPRVPAIRCNEFIGPRSNFFRSNYRYLAAPRTRRMNDPTPTNHQSFTGLTLMMLASVINKSNRSMDSFLNFRSRRISRDTK